MNRKKIYLVLFILFFVSSHSFATKPEETRVSAVLNDLHDAASAADYERYFSHYADNSVFFGTDINERWPLEVFKKYTKARFDKGNGWTYQSTSRNIYFSDNYQTA